MITIVLTIVAVVLLVALVEGISYVSERHDNKKSTAGNSPETPQEKPKVEPRGLHRR